MNYILVHKTQMPGLLFAFLICLYVSLVRQDKTANFRIVRPPPGDSDLYQILYSNTTANNPCVLV